MVRLRRGGAIGGSVCGPLARSETPAPGDTRPRQALLAGALPAPQLATDMVEVMAAPNFDQFGEVSGDVRRDRPLAGAPAMHG